MGYIQDNLLYAGERELCDVELSRVKLILAWVGGILFFWLLLIPTIKAIQATVRFASTDMAVTNKRVIEKYGWFNTICDEMYLSKIENITITQDFWGKVFNYGTVCIQGTNQNNVNFIDVVNPESVRRAINIVRDKRRG